MGVFEPSILILSGAMSVSQIGHGKVLLLCSTTLTAFILFKPQAYHSISLTSVILPFQLLSALGLFSTQNLPSALAPLNSPDNMATPTDPYQAGLANTKGTWELFKEIVADVYPSIASAAANRKAIKSLNDKIGEWAKEAKDGDGRWQQPILTRDALKAHLILSKGRPNPTGKCEASFDWAKLLYALNIRPGDGTLEWGLPSNDNDPATTGTISLDIEGEALCDIINLYKQYLASSIGRINEHRLWFGILELNDEETHSFSFASSSSKALTEPHPPFKHRFQDEGRLREGFIKFPEATVMETYLDALNDGGSDQTILLENGKKPLQDRARSLLGAWKLLEEGDWEKPYLITPTWIREASSIKRRVTTDGGQDNLLVDQICKCISDLPEVVSDLKMRVRKESWEESLRDTVKALCMFDADSFDFGWNIDALNRSEKNQIKGLVKAQLLMAVEQLSKQPEVSWTQNLLKVLTVEEIVAILNLPHEVFQKPVIVLKQIPMEWTFMAKIRG